MTDYDRVILAFANHRLGYTSEKSAFYDKTITVLDNFPLKEHVFYFIDGSFINCVFDQSPVDSVVSDDHVCSNLDDAIAKVKSLIGE